MADDSEVILPVYEATISWDGTERLVRVLATGRRPLLGMEMLDSHELVIQCQDTGLVTVDTL